MFASVCLNCLVNLLAVDCIGVLNDADFLCIDLTDNSYAKTWAREWLAEYKVLRNTKLKAGLADLILEKVAERFNNLLEIYEIRKTSDIVVGLDYRGFTAKTRLNNIRVDCSLCKKINRTDFFASSSNTRMNSSPIILRLRSGSVTPASLL